MGVRALAAALALLFGARDQTFVVQSMLGGGRANIASGVVVGRLGDVLTIATAAHAVDLAHPLRILDTSRHQYYQVIDVRDVPGYDLALIRVRAQAAFPVQPPEFGSASPGEPIWVWGNPGQSFWELSRGVVTDPNTQIPGPPKPARIAIDCASCSFGDSGSGVFAADGKLLGILSSGWRDRNGRTLFIEVEPIAPISQAMTAAR